MGIHESESTRQAIEERDAALQACEAMAKRMEYHGNSVGWWYIKARNYGDSLEEAWKALNEAGINQDGKTSVADAIKKLMEKYEKNI